MSNKVANKKSFLSCFYCVWPYILFFCFTSIIFIPSSLFLANIKEFKIEFYKVFPGILVTSILISFFLVLLAYLINIDKGLNIFNLILTYITFVIYIQSNFLNPKIPELDGADLSYLWDENRNIARMHNIFYIVFFIILILLSIKKSDEFKKYSKYVVLFFTGMQLLTFPVLVINNPLPDEYKFCFSSEDEFSVGSKKNVIIFVVDTVETTVFDQYLSSNENKLDDFTYYRQMVSGGAPTWLAMPVLLTGEEYDPRTPKDDYLAAAWDRTPLYDELHEDGYDVRFFSNYGSLEHLPENIADNSQKLIAKVTDPVSFYHNIYSLSLFYSLPISFKKYITVDSKDIIDKIVSVGENGEAAYSNKNDVFSNDINSIQQLNIKYEKAFRLIHLFGIHSTSKENRVFVLSDIMDDIYKYIDFLKKTGEYDDSLIVITGDHGLHEKGNFEINPMTLVKLPNDSKEFSVSNAPVCFRNLYATFAKGSFDDNRDYYGPGVNEISSDSNVIRMHSFGKGVVRRNIDEIESIADFDFWGNEDVSRIIIDGFDSNNNPQYRWWNPYAINAVDYSFGNKMDFSDEKIKDSLNFGVYNYNDNLYAGTEMNLCLNSEFEKNKKYKIHICSNDIIGKKQSAYVYVDGRYLQTIDFEDNEKLSEYLIEFDSDILYKMDAVTIRLVFPNAITPKMENSNNECNDVLSIELDSLWID